MFNCSSKKPLISSIVKAGLPFFSQLKKAPAVIEIVNLQHGDPLYAKIDYRMFLDMLRSEMSHTARLPNLPVLISGVSQGERWRLKPHVENTLYGHFPGSYTLGAMLAVICNDDEGEINSKLDDSNNNYPFLKDCASDLGQKSGVGR